LCQKTWYLCGLENTLGLKMDYRYDVFISYKSKSKVWLQEIFLPDFVHFLEEEVDKDVRERIFVDWHDIEAGDAWEQRLKNGLGRSKCLISLLLPTYFESNWCTKEFAVFDHRSRQCGMLTIGQPRGLIVPVALHHGSRFPEIIRSMQALDYKDFYYPNFEGYRKRKIYPRLQDELRQLARTVAQVIKEAPDWNPEWLQDHWLELPTEHLRIDKFTVTQPRI